MSPYWMAKSAASRRFSGDPTIAHHSRQMQATPPHGSRCGREARRARHGTGRWHVLSFKVLTHRASGSRRGKGIYCDVVCHLAVVVASRQLKGFSPQSFEVIPYSPLSQPRGLSPGIRPVCTGAAGLGRWGASRHSARCQRQGGSGGKPCECPQRQPIASAQETAIGRDTHFRTLCRDSL
jgi:hypothetical protein